MAQKSVVIWSEESGYQAGGAWLSGQGSAVILPEERGYLSRKCNKIVAYISLLRCCMHFAQTKIHNSYTVHIGPQCHNNIQICNNTWDELVRATAYLLNTLVRSTAKKFYKLLNN